MLRFSLRRWQATNDVYIKTRALSLDEREAICQVHSGYSLAVMRRQFHIRDDFSSTVSNEMRQDASRCSHCRCDLHADLYLVPVQGYPFCGQARLLALMHDVLVVFACYAIVRISVGSTFIACMLTIVGYSINATIVIFDRIRENLKGMKQASLEDVVNTSITETLTRSIYTSFTTFVMVAVLYVLGVATIKEFSLPLIVGVVAGGYSSVCITGALWYLLKKHSAGKAN